MKKLFIFLLLISPFTLLSDWTLEFSGKNISLSSLHLPKGYSIKNGELEFKGRIYPSDKNFHYEVNGRIKNFFFVNNRFPKGVSFPLINFSLHDGNWKLKEGSGIWDEVNFTLKGEGKLTPFSYKLNISLPSFSVEKIKKIIPYKLPPYLSSIKGDFNVTIKGKKKISGEGEFLSKGEYFRNLNAKFSWDGSEIEFSNISIKFKKGEIKGEGNLRWVNPK